MRFFEVFSRCFSDGDRLRSTDLGRARKKLPPREKFPLLSAPASPILFPFSTRHKRRGQGYAFTINRHAAGVHPAGIRRERRHGRAGGGGQTALPVERAGGRILGWTRSVPGTGAITRHLPTASARTVTTSGSPMSRGWSRRIPIAVSARKSPSSTATLNSPGTPTCAPTASIPSSASRPSTPPLSGPPPTPPTASSRSKWRCRRKKCRGRNADIVSCKIQISRCRAEALRSRHMEGERPLSRPPYHAIQTG